MVMDDAAAMAVLRTLAFCCGECDESSGAGSTVTVDNAATLMTTGETAEGIFVESGGGGGHGGSNGGNDVNLGLFSIPMDVSVGGGGGIAGSGSSFSAPVSLSIITQDYCAPLSTGPIARRLRHVSLRTAPASGRFVSLQFSTCIMPQRREATHIGSRRALRSWPVGNFCRQSAPWQPAKN